MSYKIQIDDEVREATAEETQRIDVLRDEASKLQQMREVRLAAKVSARAKLAALGLTDDEIAALAG